MKSKVKAIDYGPILDPKRVHGYKGVRWVENVSRGLRLVGFADEVAKKAGRRLDHQGWHTDDDGANGVYRGVVYQIPTRDGAAYVSVYKHVDFECASCRILASEITDEAPTCDCEVSE